MSATDDEDATVAGMIKLNFNPKWLEYGAMSKQFLSDLVARYEQSKDKNTEHYRYAAFRQLLTPERVLDDEMVDRYIELAELDEDQNMAQAALGELIRWEGLTDAQLERLSTHRAFAAETLQKIIKRKQLLRELFSTSLTDEAFAQYISSGDAVVQRELLSKSVVSRKQLETLKAQGANRAVRNMAKDKLRQQ